MMRPRSPRRGGGLLSLLLVLAAGLPVFAADPTVRFRWPLLKQDFQHSINYVDLDPGPGLSDWNCQAVTYAGHLGNDIMIRDFTEQDFGRFVVAAAPGTVIEVEDGFYDRNTVPNSFYPNFVQIQHDDGTTTSYLHLRKWSSLVATGQRVLEGQPLGLVGCSGNCADPHVHFEVNNGGSTYEPFAGPCRSGASLWNFAQPAHVSTNPIAVYDFDSALTPPDGLTIKFRPPGQRHVKQVSPGGTAHYVWTRFTDAHNGDVLRVVWRRPDNSIAQDSPLTLSSFAAFDWRWFGATLPPSGSTGTWKIEVYLNGVLSGTKTFTYDGVAYQPPTGTGRTLAVSRGIARGLLKGSDADGDLDSFAVSTAPAHGELTLAGPRQSWFNYKPQAGYTGTDTFQFQAKDAQGTLSAPATMTLNVTSLRANVLELEAEADNEYVSIPGNGSLNLPPGFTVEAWVKRTIGSSKWAQLIDRRNPTSLDNYGWNVYVQSDGKIVLSMGRGIDRWYIYSTNPLPFDRWTHFAATWDGTYAHVYIDGKDDSGAWYFPGPIDYTGVSETRIGGSFAQFEAFHGLIDEMRIWSVARTPAQILDGMSCNFFNQPVPATVRALWRFNGDLTDASTYGNTGVLSGAASFLRVPDSGVPLNCANPDQDGDGVKDALDNCPLDPNAGQADADGDKVGDACDLCASTKTQRQIDSDGDGVGDACDKCPFLGDTEQIDTDGDGAGDICDPQPTNAAVGVPSANITLTLTHNRSSGITTINWNAEPKSATYEVYRGSQSDVAARFYGVCQNSRDGNTADTTFAENQAPPAGSAYYFLVLGAGSDGTRGLAGLDSDGRQRDLRAKDCR